MKDDIIFIGLPMLAVIGLLFAAFAVHWSWGLFVIPIVLIYGMI